MLFGVVLASVFCGALGSRLPYIVGGHDVTEPGKYPWQASLQIHGGHACGAAVISERWLVTAAHCIISSVSAYTVVLGLHDRLTKLEGKHASYRVKRTVRHPGWSMSGANGYPNDIALMYLTTDADLSGEFASAIKPATVNQDFTGNDDCHITGWGKMSYNSNMPNILQEAKVDIYTKEYCVSRWGGKIGNYHLCLGKDGMSGACSGDSGGPLVCKVGNNWRLAGVTSWGRPDCSPEYPSVYTSVAYYRSWINDVTK